MENSLRNHALVQQQNQQQQRNREEYYRNNGIIRSSSSTAAPASSSYHGNISIHSTNITSNRSHTSGASSSGKGSRSSTTGSSRSTRSGEASDEAVQGPVGSLLHNHHHNELNYQQKQYLYHHHQQQQQYFQQQRYPQHHLYCSVFQQQDQCGNHIYRDSSSSSQRSSSRQHHYTEQHRIKSHVGESTAEGTASSLSHYSDILGSISASFASNPSAEEAYRKTKHQFSVCTHGGDSNPSRSLMYRRGMHSPSLTFRSSCSYFEPFQEVLQNGLRGQENEETSSHGHNSSINCSSKSNKIRKVNIVRRMTLNANELFLLWRSEHSKIDKHHRGRKNSNSDGTASSSSRANKKEHLSPHGQTFAQMSLSDGSHIHGHGSKKQTGSLSAVIESASQTSSTTRSKSASSRNPRCSNGSLEQSGYSKGDGSQSMRSEDRSRTSSTIATQSSMGTRNSFPSFGTLPPRGKCLTHPSKGVSNKDFCDNVEGNLIVYENDNISVPKKKVCVLTRGKVPRNAPSSDFRVQCLLGQGTFAQVFRCLHVQTGQQVAIKIIKNKPAYTRQAAAEIDVIRALTKIKNGAANSSNTYNGQSLNNSPHYIIDMICYFLYKDHLCLVFELLGLNLYEVLKKRQFRGLPLVVTQNIIRQAILGTKELAQRNIVHCDLKPENILLVDEEDSESMKSAGECRRVQASSLCSTRTTSSFPKEKINQKCAQTLPSRIEANDSLGQTQSSKYKYDTQRSNMNVNDEKEKTQTGQTHSTGGSKSKAAVDNTTEQLKEQIERKEQNRQVTIMTEDSITTVSKSFQNLKGSTTPGSKSPVRSSTAVPERSETHPNSSQQIKLIDFGSACFEGQIPHTYIQSRFYRSPEVLLGLAYDSAIDMWSLGCVAAELFLGLPILPGVHEHDQLGRMIEMIGDISDWMLEQGTKSSKYFVKYVPAATREPTPPVQSTCTTPDVPSTLTEAAQSSRSLSEAPRPSSQWRIKTQHEYITSLSKSDVEKKGGLDKLKKQPRSRYFRRRLLADIIYHKGQSSKQENPRLLKYFVHFLYGILDPDPFKRWTAFQVANHPFFTGEMMRENIDPSSVKDDNQANRLFDLYWEAPSDPTIWRRKLLNVQKTREKQKAARRFNRGRGHSRSRSVSPSSQEGLPTLRKVFSKDNVDRDDAQPIFRSDADEISHQSVGHITRQGPCRYIMRQRSYQGSLNVLSSMTQFGRNQNIRHLRCNVGAQPSFSGPQSLSESGNSIAFPGSFNEVDFALALHRPGVVPTGDSVTTATTSTTSVSSENNSRSTYNQSNNQTSQIGSFGSHQVLQYSYQQRWVPTAGSLSKVSRSFEEGNIAPTVSASIPNIIASRQQPILYSSSQGSRIDTGPTIARQAQITVDADTPMELGSEIVPTESASPMSAKTVVHPPHETKKTLLLDDSSSCVSGDLEMKKASPIQNIGAYDNPQLYQQQLVAMHQQFEQQQLLLEQQQAAIALQHEQLRALYGIPDSPSILSSDGQNGNAIRSPHVGMPIAPTSLNAQQFCIPDTPGIPPTSIHVQQFGAHNTSGTTTNAQQFRISDNFQSPVQSVSLNPQQLRVASTPTPIHSGSYYLLRTPSNQGMAIQSTSQVHGMATLHSILPGQLPGLPIGPVQIPTLAQIGLPSVTDMGRIPQIQGVRTSGSVPPSEGVPSACTSGMPLNQAITNKSRPISSRHYRNSNKQ